MPIVKQCGRCGKTFEDTWNKSTMCSLACRLWSRVAIGKPDECWPWTLSKADKGYGQIMVRTNGQRRPLGTHRVAWEVTHGSIPDGLWVLHSCDNPPCCNPSHMRLGTNADNVADMIARKRRTVVNYARGDRHGSHTQPEKWARGAAHWTAKAKLARLGNADTIPPQVAPAPPADPAQ